MPLALVDAVVFVQGVKEPVQDPVKVVVMGIAQEVVKWLVRRPVELLSE